MANETLRLLISTALAAGCGAVIKWLLDGVIEWRKEDGKPISPKTRRRLALAANIVVPSALYGLAVLLGLLQYSIAEHILYVFTAFTSNQVVHGEQELMTGKEVRLKKMGLLDGTNRKED